MGMEQSFSEEFEKAAACQITIEQQDFSAARLARFLHGSNAAVVLKPYVYLTPGKVVPLPADDAAPTTTRKPNAVVQ